MQLVNDSRNDESCVACSIKKTNEPTEKKWNKKANKLKKYSKKNQSDCNKNNNDCMSIDVESVVNPPSINV